MNGYIAFYRGKQVEVYAVSSYEAQQKAAVVFKARKSYEVTVMLAEKDGRSVHIGYVVGQHWLTAYQRVEETNA
jgi:hypothetical protein